ncbi:hypothetical protein METBIDRAFT_36560 [Metschnikowia bicuspidata var. bicuspidata NRRL YB-4993]|uniref:Uncharacterized protein n=1 Tax=Metschnikowia bicuspidata var. bicuspidata NRRL YB-4993 TaxID=869754 RepID=A0A1A0HKA9_9ASCO|nr:hypothetical protein METBIDRAFT_36560 [Metschnikowia bicuspidata var. bicuspidata NRRL YB-4993]OBA24322.1 hypothetical protein METBIDRAFT_36560 [Metschnikowia bicuspidata var. bicuspidata NRRL YB-4993]
MTTVVPGQYLVPEYKTEAGESGDVVLRYFPGKGAVLSSIDSGSRSIPVIVATVLGEQVIQEIKKNELETPDHETNDDKEEESISKKEDSNIRTFLVSVVLGKKSEYTQYAKEIDASASDSVSATATNLPREGDEVLVRITRLNLKQAFCEVLCVYGYGNVSPDGGLGSNGTSAHFSVPMGGGSQILSSYGAVASSQSFMSGAQPLDIGEAFKAVIRSQDVRSTDRDKVKIIDCFRPGDLVKAVVLSLGDGSNYYLTTARNDLGVIFAKSEGGAGDLMIAVDWETMVCEKTGVVEKRKCAKLFE